MSLKEEMALMELHQERGTLKQFMEGTAPPIKGGSEAVYAKVEQMKNRTTPPVTRNRR